MTKKMSEKNKKELIARLKSATNALKNVLIEIDVAYQCFTEIKASAGYCTITQQFYQTNEKEYKFYF